MSPPRVSVVMAAYNAAPYIDAAIESVVGQTFSDFELIIVDNASTDGTREAIDRWLARDPRIRVVDSRENTGAAGGANLGIAAATAPLVARMDADDISYPTRLEEEVKVLDDHPEVVIVGTLTIGLDERGRKVRPLDRWPLHLRNSIFPVANGSTVFRREAFHAVGGYRPECVLWEDVDFFLRITALGPPAIIPRALYGYRYHTSSSSHWSRLEQTFMVMGKALRAYHAGAAYESLDVTTIPEQWSARSQFAYLAYRNALRLWAGERTGGVRRYLRLRGAGFRPRFLIVSTLGALAPRTVRFLLAKGVGLRDFLSGLIYPIDQVIIGWAPPLQPPRKAEDETPTSA